MEEAELKYLEFLQNAIARMASNSFMVKGWSVALGTGVLGFGIKDHDWILALAAILPVLCFWMLDAYYLALERLFRHVWKGALRGSRGRFDMNPGRVEWTLWIQMAWRPAVCLVHLPVVLGSLIAATVMVYASAG